MSDLQKNPAEFIAREMASIAQNATSRLLSAMTHNQFWCPFSWRQCFYDAIAVNTSYDFGNVDLPSCVADDVDLANPLCPTIVDFWAEQKASCCPLITLTNMGTVGMAMLITPGDDNSIHLFHLDELESGRWVCIAAATVVDTEGCHTVECPDAVWKTDATRLATEDALRTRAAGFDGLMRHWRATPFTTMTKSLGLKWGKGERTAFKFQFPPPRQ